MIILSHVYYYLVMLLTSILYKTVSVEQGMLTIFGI